MIEELSTDRIATCTIKHDILRGEREGGKGREKQQREKPNAYIGLIPRFQAIGTDQYRLTVLRTG